MSAPNLRNLNAAQRVVVLPTGRVINLDAIRHQGGESFTYGYFEVGQYLSQSQRMAFPTYDPTNANRRASDQRLAAEGRAATDGSTNTLSLFLEGVADDLNLRKPDGTLSQLKTLALAAAFVAALWIIFQIVKSWKGAR